MRNGPSKLNLVARMALDVIANSDALYHDVQHTMLVTLVGQEILRGRHLEKMLTPDDWLHFTVALLCHDIGYVRGVCSGDTTTSFVIDESGNRATPPRGATDAFLTPYHVDRGKIFVRERGGPVPFLDEERVVKAIELTRFPIPDDRDHQETNTEAGLLRAADLIGQLADPRYLQKLSNLYYEFAETGTAEKLGLTSAADLADQYPGFFWNAGQFNRFGNTFLINEWNGPTSLPHEDLTSIDMVRCEKRIRRSTRWRRMRFLGVELPPPLAWPTHPSVYSSPGKGPKRDCPCSIAKT